MQSNTKFQELLSSRENEICFRDTDETCVSVLPISVNPWASDKSAEMQ